MKVLVTGAAGFVGTHVMERLMQEGHTPIAVDNLEGGLSPDVKRWYVRETRQQGRFEFYENDISEYTQTYDLIRAVRADAVMHLAARHEPESGAPLAELSRVNVDGTLNVLEACRRTAIRRFVLASSWEVYGDAKPPFDETKTPLRPRTGVGATKLIAEHYARVYANLFHIRTTVLRFFPLYGPRQRPDMCFARVAKSAGGNKPAILSDHPDSSLDFTYIEDAAEAVVRGLDTQEEFSIFNVGTGRAMKMRDAVKKLQSVLGLNARVALRGSPAVKGYAGTRRAREALGFEAKTSFDAGLKRYAQWYAHMRPTIRMKK